MLVKTKKARTDAILTGDTREYRYPILSSLMSILHRLTMVCSIYLEARKSQILKKVVKLIKVLELLQKVLMIIMLNQMMRTIDCTQLI